MKKIFLLAVILTALVGLVSCMPPIETPKQSNPSKPYFFYFYSIDKTKMVGDFASLLPVEPTSADPHTVSCSGLTDEQYVQVERHILTNPVANEYFTKDKFKNAGFPNTASETAKTAMENALNDLITRGKNGIVVYGIYNPDDDDVNYWAITN